jgi:hypothetical protein
MTSGPDLPERDPALERAWRAQSRETPPAELDRAILAAAHRAVGSGPREASKSPEAKQPQRWWMPLAAAATIGAVAIGLLQLTPQDAGIVAPTERVVAVAPHRDAASSDGKASAVPPPATPKAARAPAVSQAPASSAAVAPPMATGAGRAKEMADRGEPVAPDALARGADKAMEPADARESAARRKADAGVGAAPPPSPSTAASAVAVPFPASAPVPVPAAAPEPAAAPAPAPAAAPPPSLARAPASASPSAPIAAASAPPGARDAPGAVGKLEQRAPEPFPAAPRKIEAAEAKKDAGRATQDAAPAPRVAAAPPPIASVEQDARSAQRKDVAAERQSAAAGAPPAPAEAASTLASAPGGTGAPMRMRENTAVRDEMRAQAAPQPLAKQAPMNAAEAKQKARDPDAWIARIRKLRDDGNTAEAIRELREFREYVPNADRRIPPDLRDLANAVRP